MCRSTINFRVTVGLAFDVMSELVYVCIYVPVLIFELSPFEKTTIPTVAYYGIKRDVVFSN